jgi:Tfp pilus assembly protein PilF
MIDTHNPTKKTAEDYFIEAMRINDDKQRAELLEKAVQLDNKFADAYLELGKSYLWLKKFKKAERMLRISISLDNDGWAHLYLGNLFFTKKDFGAAEIEFSKSKQILSDIAVPFWCLADVYRAQGNIKKSEKFYRAAIKLQPTDADSLACLGRLLLEEKRLTQGAKYIKQALEHDKSCKVALKWKKQYKIK